MMAWRFIKAHCPRRPEPSNCPRRTEPSNITSHKIRERLCRPYRPYRPSNFGDLRSRNAAAPSAKSAEVYMATCVSSSSRSISARLSG